MRAVNIGELKNQLSSFLQHLKKGENTVITERSIPVALIVTFRHGSEWQHEAQLVAEGALKMPEEEMDWDQFFLLPFRRVPLHLAVEATVESRGDR